jgi:glycosyltransferase involved in cell wall biosynthesis
MCAGPGQVAGEEPIRVSSIPRILILTASHLCRNPRVVKEATTLGAAGFDVTVMSVSNRARFEAMDRELMQGLPFKRRVIDYTARDPRTRWRDFVQRSLTWGARFLCNRVKWELAQSLGPATALLKLARAHSAALTVVHTEIPLWIGQDLIKSGRRVAVDVEDWYSEDLLFADRRSRPQRLLRRAEEFVLNHADYASATSKSMAEALANAYRCPVPVVLHNTFPLQDRSHLDQPPGSHPPTFIWFSQTIGPGRGLELFLAAWGRTQTPSVVYLLGDERPGYHRHLRSLLPSARREDLRILPLVSPAQLPLKLAEFDLGLALEPHLPLNRDLTITNKIFQYMNAGLALIATDTAGQREVMQAAPESGLLVQAHETTRLTLELDTLLNDHARIRRCQQASREAARTRFSWEHDAPRLCQSVESALA